jgi:transglutaminase/protease-like cytokinesis protein 3
MVSGYALISKPSKAFQVMEKFTSNHAWNAVLIDHKWYLVDPTWASGYTNRAVTKFTRKRNDFYYLTPAEDFILDHYPDDPQWQLLGSPVDWKGFFTNARYRARNK